MKFEVKLLKLNKNLLQHEFYLMSSFLKKTDGKLTFQNKEKLDNVFWT